MCPRRASFLAVAILASVPGLAAAQAGPPATVDAVVDRIVAQENAEMQKLRQYSPLVETYVQTLKPDDAMGSVPTTDRYFLGKAELKAGLDIEPLSSAQAGPNSKSLSGRFGTLLGMNIVPEGFLQMVFVDSNGGFDRKHYKFEYVRREFLGEVRCLVFDLTPVKAGEHGRFEGRIWVEDQGFHIVRFNGAYLHPSKSTYFFHFDSWRVFAGDNEWLPAYIYCEETNLHYGMARKLTFKAQTRLWG